MDGSSIDRDFAEYSPVGRAARKSGREAGGETGCGGDGAAKILFGRMGRHGDVSEIGGLSEWREEHGCGNRQAWAGRKLADQYVSCAGPRGRSRRVTCDDVGHQ